MNTHSFHQKTLAALGVLLCGAGGIGISRALDGANEFFHHAGFDFPIINKGVFTHEWAIDRLAELNQEPDNIKRAILEIVNWRYFLDKPELFEPTLNRLQLILAPAG